MRCNICDRGLTEKEIVFNKELDAYEPCGECLEIALEAAYSDGFIREDDDDVLILPFEHEEDIDFVFPETGDSYEN